MTNLITKVTKAFGNLLGYFKNVTLKEETTAVSILGQLLEYLDYFLFKYLVTLFTNEVLTIGNRFKIQSVTSCVTRFGKISPIWPNLKSLSQFF